MPQLTPFYFINQIVYTLLLVSFLLYTLCKYILPLFSYLYNTRLFIIKLK